MIIEPIWNGCFKLFLEDRAKDIFTLIHSYVTSLASDMAARFGSQSESGDDTPEDSWERLKDILADGRVQVNDRVFVRKHPGRFATIIDGETVEFEGRQMLINALALGFVSVRAALDFFDGVSLRESL
jgi:hypothetical protein